MKNKTNENAEKFQGNMKDNPYAKAKGKVAEIYDWERCSGCNEYNNCICDIDADYTSRMVSNMYPALIPLSKEEQIEKEYQEMRELRFNYEYDMNQDVSWEEAYNNKHYGGME